MSPDEDLLRLFVAVEVAPEPREAIRRLQGDLKGRDLAGLRWVRPEGIHLTLKFLGETPATSVPAINAAVEAATRGMSGFRLALGRTGTFGSRRSPRVLWLDITGDVERLRQLQAAVERALTEAGFPPEERRFSPHLTLARVPQPARPGTGDSISRALEAVSVPHSEFDVGEVVLMRSTLQPGGAVYERLGSFPLA